MGIRIDRSSIRIQSESSSLLAERTRSQRFQETLSDGALLLLRGIEAASRTLPGGPFIAATIRGVAAQPLSRATSASSDSLEAALSTGHQDAMSLLLLQHQIQEENRVYSTLSNVLKARHETTKTAINNIR
ncbi:MAG: hypothetical protein NZM37_11895 [Sandaracinaceae bacterium]|nr:hypothetical protein [Sandaracinaceae bacterium]